jgi:hypothetical protein
MHIVLNVRLVLTLYVQKDTFVCVHLLYKALLGKLPLYLCSLVSYTTNSYHT